MTRWFFFLEGQQHDRKQVAARETKKETSVGREVKD